MNKMIMNMLAVAMALCMTFSCAKDDGASETYQPKTEVGKAFLAADQVNRVYTDSTFVLAIGVEETDVHFQSMNGYIVRAYVIKADLKTPGVQFKVGMPNDSYKFNAERQVLTEQAAAIDRPGERIVCMTNGDYWGTSSSIFPRGPIVRSGIVLNEVFNYEERLAQQALSYIAVRKDGTMTIDFKDSYAAESADFKEASGAGVVLLKDGKIPLINPNWTARDPRTAIGYTEDGIVYMLVADGRQDFLSYGMTYAEMSSVFKSLGCVAAAVEDGGGSAELIIRHPIAGIWQVRNSPSDGNERAVMSSWMVTVDEP